MQVQGSGSRVLIVGAAGGIGGAATAALTAAGHEVVAADIRLDALPDEAAQKLYLDVTDDASIAAAVDAVEAAGPIDSLICCVGVSIWTPIEVADRTQLEDVFSLNVIGPMQLARAVLPAMRERGSGQIVMLSSGAGRMVTPLIGWYAATKHAIEAACEALRYDVGHLGVRVSVVEPGRGRYVTSDVSTPAGAGISPRNVSPDWSDAAGSLTWNSPAGEAGAIAAPSSVMQGRASAEGASVAVLGRAIGYAAKAVPDPASAENRSAATAALVKRAVVGMVSPCRRPALAEAPWSCAWGTSLSPRMARSVPGPGAHATRGGNRT